MTRILPPWLFGLCLSVELLAAQSAVPDSVCAGCHANIAASYGTTGMARSFSQARRVAIPLQSAPFFHAPSNAFFFLIRRGPSLYHRRWLKGQDGTEMHVEELSVDYVMGSGNHAMTFLHRTAAGALIELPLAWYADKGGYFALNPGFDSSHPLTRRKIDYDCMFCHNAYPEIPARGAQQGAEPLYAGPLPEGIGCQRCHGPGGRHVAAAKAAVPAASIRSAIVNPARLSTERQNEVCLQCHLETTSGNLPSIIRRFERAPFSYTPGEPLEKYVLHFDHAPGTGHDDKFEIVSAAYRLGKSACFQKSSAMLCTTCHNPHAKNTALVAAACGKCHAAEALPVSGKHPAGADCAACHMPKRRTEDAVHVVMTDHFIQRQPPAVDWLAERVERHAAQDEDYRGEVVPFLPARNMDPLYLAVAQVLHGANLTGGIPLLEETLRLRRPREAEYYVTLGNAWQRSQRPDKAAEAFREAARMAPRSARVHCFLGIALQQSGASVPAAEALQKATLLDPADAVSWHQLGLLDSAAGRTAEAVEKARRAIALKPDLLDARNSLGANLTTLGDRAGAEKAFRDALQIDPWFATAHGNLARLLAVSDPAQALDHFGTAVRLRPDFAPDRHEYALALVRANDFPRARTQVDAALRLLPDFVDARILSGGLWAREKRFDLARNDYQEALRVQPDSGRAHLDLARVLASLGDRAGAIAHLRIAAKSSDVNSRALATEALRNVGASPE